MRELGKIEAVDVRDIWKHEATCFTPWLAKPENLDLLGEALGMKLDPVDREAPVDLFSLDILARDRETGGLVVIENQLEWSDHDHLGKLLTYAADYEARTAVWVVASQWEKTQPNCDDETGRARIVSPFYKAHLAAIDWLNRWTPGEIGFWGVEVRAIKIRDSLPAPEFRVVLSPSGWVRGEQAGDSLPWEEKMRRFFKPLMNRLFEKGFAGKVRAEYRDPTMYSNYFPSGFKGMEYAWQIADSVSAFIWIVRQSREDKERILCKLEEAKAKFEGEPGVEWYRGKWDNVAHGSLGIKTKGTIGDRQEKLEQHKEWLLEYLPRLKEVLDPHLERIMAEAQRKEE